MEAGIIVLTAFISPFRNDRDRVRGTVKPGDFIEIYCDTPLDICETRDVKGMYKKARVGEILEFTGISSPYQFPEKPELIVNTGTVTLDDCVQQIIGDMIRRGVYALQPNTMLDPGSKKHCQESGIKL
jgi:adenylylsulfate kinase